METAVTTNVPTESSVWCRGCGLDAVTGAACGNCGTALEPPHPGQRRAGMVVDTGARFRTVLGIALGETGGAVSVAVKGDVPLSMPVADFDRLKPVAVPGPAVSGASGRLLAALDAMRGKQINAKWSATLIENAARGHALATQGSRRGAALDLIGLGRTDGLAALGLSSSELTWYAAYHAWFVGDNIGLLDRLEQLPNAGYAARIRLLSARVAALLQDAALAGRAAKQAALFADQSLEAAALCAALGAQDARTIDVLGAYLAAIPNDPADAEFATVRALASATANLDASGIVPDAGFPASRALMLYLSGRQGVPLDASVSAVSRLPVPLLDELIDVGALGAASAANPEWPLDNAGYLRCRLDPATASEADLRANGFTAELARRAFLSGDAALLASLPASDAAVAHYSALATWTAPDGACRLDGLREPAARILSAVARLRAHVAETGVAVDVPDEVAADADTRTVLAPLAREGGLWLSDAARSRYPGTADWMDLCHLEKLVYDVAWGEAAEAGVALAERAERNGEWAIAAEARSLGALAQARLGLADVALRTLEPALGSECVTPLLINAAIVAVPLGSHAVIPYLARFAARESDDEIRAAAVTRAVDLWLADDSAQTYPDSLRNLVRAELARPCEEAHLRMLLQLSVAQDRDWLAGSGPIPAADPDRSAMIEYYRLKARAASPDYPDTLKDMATRLKEILAAPTPRPWVASELEWLVELLDQSVHQDFGATEAVGVVPAIDVLLDAGVLDPVSRLVLAAQAGAHYAYFLGDERRTLSAAAEQRYIFQPYVDYSSDKYGLSEGAREYVGSELARCVRVASAALAVDTETAYDEYTDEWNRLVDLRRMSNEYGQAPWQQRQREILQDIDRRCERLRRYQNALATLPVANETDQSWREKLPELVDTWSAEAVRLRRFV